MKPTLSSLPSTSFLTAASYSSPPGKLPLLSPLRGDAAESVPSKVASVATSAASRAPAPSVRLKKLAAGRASRLRQ